MHCITRFPFPVIINVGDRGGAGWRQQLSAVPAGAIPTTAATAPVYHWAHPHYKAGAGFEPWWIL